MTNAEAAKQVKEFRQKLELVKQANKRNVELLAQLKGAYEAKVNKILNEIEEIANNLESTSDPDADEAYYRLRELAENIRDKG